MKEEDEIGKVPFLPYHIQYNILFLYFISIDVDIDYLAEVKFINVLCHKVTFHFLDFYTICFANKSLLTVG